MRGDAVALYRVAQESLGRTRGGDGPVLIECVAYGVEGSGGGAPGDPLVQMKEFLLGRRVCTKAWLERAGERLRRRIAGDGGSRSSDLEQFRDAPHEVLTPSRQQVPPLRYASVGMTSSIFIQMDREAVRDYTARLHWILQFSDRY